jgi:hypothetical protein
MVYKWFGEGEKGGSIWNINYVGYESQFILQQQ